MNEGNKNVGSSASEAFLELIKKLAEGAIVFASLLFVAGWGYLYGYYRNGFGLSLGDVDFPTESALMFSARVIFHWHSFCFLLIVAMVYALIRHYVARTNAGRAVLVIMLFVITAWTELFIAVGVGVGDAQSDQVRKTSRLSPVTVVILTAEARTDVTKDAEDKDAAKRKLGETQDRYDNLCGGSNLLLLLHSEKAFYFVQPVDTLGPGNFHVCIIPAEQVRAIRLEVPVGGRK
jgi:hypothetical protein